MKFHKFREYLQNYLLHSYTLFLDFRFAPRIKDMADKRLYMPSAQSNYSALDTLMSGTININHIRTNWDEVLRLATPIQQGIVTASLIVRKISSYPCQNGLAVALREIGRMERTLFYVGLVDESGTTPKSNSRIKQG